MTSHPVPAPDHVEITRRLYEYAYGLDQRDFELYRSIFCDEITVDFSSYNDRPPRTITADDWVEGLRPLFTGLDATQHSMSNPLVDIDAGGDRARCRMYMQAAHFLFDADQPEYTIGGFYDDRLRRTRDGWRIEAVTLTIWWRRGDPGIMPIATRRGADRLNEDG